MRSPWLVCIVAATAVLVAGVAWACECVYFASAEHQLSEAKLAFVGQAVVTLSDSNQAVDPGDHVTRFMVSRTIKGPHRTFRSVSHYPGPEGGTCGVDFPPDQEVLVIATISADRLVTSSCHQPRFPLADYDRAARR